MEETETGELDGIGEDGVHGALGAETAGSEIEEDGNVAELEISVGDERRVEGALGNAVAVPIAGGIEGEPGTGVALAEVGGFSFGLRDAAGMGGGQGDDR